MKYKDSHQPVPVRVKDLLDRMTLQEKAGQLRQQIFGWQAYDLNQETREIILTDTFKEEVALGNGLGALYGLFRADPWSQVDYGKGLLPDDSARATNMIQQYMIDHTRLGIPVLFSEESPHGHMALDGTLFPVNLGIGASFNPALYEAACACMAAEIRSRGTHLALISTLDIAQDPRWGRTEECFGEDPFLAAQMTCSAVRGLQGQTSDQLTDTDKVAAVLKHFCAQGASAGGHNGKNAIIGERELREIHFPAMKAGVEAGAAGCMAAYNVIDGIYCHANRWLLNTILKQEWQFSGFVMSDGCAVDNLRTMTGSHTAAAALAVKAGVDLDLWNQSFRYLETAVDQALLSEQCLDEAVSRVLTLKFRLGLFDQPFTDEKNAVSVVGSNHHKTLSLQTARESLVLLKNDNETLPFNSHIASIAVIGPNANALYNQLGDYTAPQRSRSGYTVLDGFKEISGDQVQIRYARGCGVLDRSKAGFGEALNLVSQSDAVVLCLGGSSARDFSMQFDQNGAAIVSGLKGEMDCGEGVDVADLELGGLQIELAKAVIASGKPVVTVLIQGRPYAISWLAKHSPAILCAWYPGPMGGLAIAEAIWGHFSPGGRLPVSIPHSTSQLPVYYNQRASADYLDMTGKALYSFGYGLSYTQFTYSQMKVLPKSISYNSLTKGETIRIGVTVTNTGLMAGAEVVALYLGDPVSSISRREKELKAFKKIHLQPGESQIVYLCLDKESLSLWDPDMAFVVEPGCFDFYLGSPDQPVLTGQFTVTGSLSSDPVSETGC